MFGENKKSVGFSFSREVKTDRLVGFHSESNGRRGSLRFDSRKKCFIVQAGESRQQTKKNTQNAILLIFNCLYQLQDSVDLLQLSTEKKIIWGVWGVESCKFDSTRLDSTYFPTIPTRLDSTRFESSRVESSCRVLDSVSVSDSYTFFILKWIS